MKYTLDWAKYADVSRRMIAEGQVLLRNEDRALPLRNNDKVALFGRVQTDYIKSGTGSGGMVNTPYVVSILDALKEEEGIELNNTLLKIYTDWIEEHPYDKGKGWAMEPWCQVEMELDDKVVSDAAKESNVAIVIIGRTAGEDKDNSASKGSYFLTDGEEEMLRKVCGAFDRVVVVLNVGNIIDMSFVDKYKPQAVLYAWQGGSEGGHGTVDVLMGKVCPSGHLSDTIAMDIEDYPSTANFGGKEFNHYEEDIYVGYRYFETVAADKVRYPFGFGLSYTTFERSYVYGITEFDEISLNVRIKNTGSVEGKDVVQVYYEAPQGKLCKPLRQLVSFAKTESILPGEETSVNITFDISKMASFDDSGVTGHKDAYVMEDGEYKIYAGDNVRSAEYVASFMLGETVVVSQLTEACTPVADMKRMVIRDGAIEKENVPKRSYDLMERIASKRPDAKEYVGDKGYKFADVVKGDVTVDDFLSQLTDEDLVDMTRGEGMCSPKVTPGIAGSFGGVTKRLNEEFGMPIAGCSDGPSGIRMDCGAEAFSLPSGTLQACSFNLPLIEELYEYEGLELRKNRIDVLLGPGINIHRNPLNGRNFEYYSEDPYLTGACAVAELRGLHKVNVTGTCKHFATNNQETNRHGVDAILSARALREIYLKPYEMAVKNGGAYCIMTSYGPLNGIWTAGNYDLCTTILRGEWGYKGLVMTDWWAKINEDGSKDADIKQTTAMIRSQNDVYMVTADSESNANEDDSMQGLADGRIGRGELLRAAKNICYVLAKSPVGVNLVEGVTDVEEINRPEGSGKIMNIMPYVIVGEDTLIDIEGLRCEAGYENMYTMRIPKLGKYSMNFKLRSGLGELSQTSLSVFENGVPMGTITITGTGREWVERSIQIESLVGQDNFVGIYFAQTGTEIESIRIKFEKDLDMDALAK